MLKIMLNHAKQILCVAHSFLVYIFNKILTGKLIMGTGLTSHILYMCAYIC